MKTREQYEEAVKGPGKFELEEPWTPYFWDLVLNGEGEDMLIDAQDEGECLVDYTRFTIDGNDIELFPELEEWRGREIQVREDSQGFVYSQVQ